MKLTVLSLAIALATGTKLEPSQQKSLIQQSFSFDVPKVNVEDIKKKVEEHVEEPKKKVEEATNDVKAKAEDVKNDVKAKADEVKTKVDEIKSKVEQAQAKIENAKAKVEEAKVKAEEIKAKAEQAPKPVTDKIDEKDKQAIKQSAEQHVMNVIADTLKQPLQVVNTTAAILNNPETRMVAKMVGGQDGVEKLEKAQAIANKTLNVTNVLKAKGKPQESQNNATTGLNEQQNNSTVKQIIQHHVQNAVVDTLRAPFQSVNTTGEILNSQEARVATKVVGGQDAVNKLEKVQSVFNKTNNAIEKVDNQARKVAI